MAVGQSKVTAQGQIFVHTEVQRKLGIGPRSILEWDEESDAVLSDRAIFPKRSRKISMRAVDSNVLVRLVIRDDEKLVAGRGRIP